MTAIRAMGPDDVPAAAALNLATALAAYGHIFPPSAPKPTLAEMVDRWEGALTRGSGWVEAEAGIICGVVALEPEPEGGRLSSLYVAPAWWGRGIGSRLASTVVAAAHERAWWPLRLWVLEANHRSRRWYERRGWCPEEDRRRKVWDEIDDIGYIFGSDP